MKIININSNINSKCFKDDLLKSIILYSMEWASVDLTPSGQLRPSSRRVY